MSGAAMLAAVAATPEFEMDADRAAKIEAATMSLAELYPMGFNRKLIAWTNFSFAFGGWFVPGAIAWWKKPGKPGPRRVIPMQPVTQAQQQPVTQSAETAPTRHTSSLELPMVSDPTKAQVPSEMWRQPGDIIDPNPNEDIAGE